MKNKKKEKKSFSEKSQKELILMSNKDILKARKIFYQLIEEEEKSTKAIEFLTRFIESTNNIYTIKNDLKLEVWIYKDGIYIPNGISELKEQLRKILDSGFSPCFYNPILDRINADTMIEIKEFLNNINSKKNAHLLPVQNGILNLITKELQPFTPSLIFLNKLPIKYNPKAKCPNIEKHFEDVLTTKDDSIVMFEIIGFCLWKDYFIEKAFLFSGNGRNGKSKTLELIKTLLGYENCCAVPLTEFREDSFSISELFGKMVNLAGDLANTSLKDTGNFKMSVGRDYIGANRKFLTKIHFVNYSKHLFACNELPKVYDNSTGFWERWVVLDFPYTFKEESEYNKIMKGTNEELKKNIKIMNPEHINKITTQEELEGLLLKAIEGLDRILKNKSFSYSIGSEEIKKNWTRKADSFLAFCQDNIESGDINEDTISKANLRKYYHLYCKKNKLKGSSDLNIKITLEEYYGVSEQRIHSQETFWAGIKLIKQESENKSKDKKDWTYWELEEDWKEKNQKPKQFF